jgi:hypothetical protein
MSVVHGTAAKDPARLRPRVMIYGVGYYGLEAVRILIKNGWPIVAAVNRAGPKIGEDLGRLAGLNEDLGVVVQDCETADYATLGADIALVVQTERLSLNFVAYEPRRDFRRLQFLRRWSHDREHGEEICTGSPRSSGQDGV